MEVALIVVKSSLPANSSINAGSINGGGANGSIRVFGGNSVTLGNIVTFGGNAGGLI